MSKMANGWVFIGVVAVGAALFGTAEARKGLKRLYRGVRDELKHVKLPKTPVESALTALNTLGGNRPTGEPHIVGALVPIAMIFLNGRKVMVPQLAWIGLGSIVIQELVRRNPDLIPSLLRDRDTRA